MKAIINLCINGGSGMSTCKSAELSYEQQKKCSFCTGKSTGGEYCKSLKFGEFCGSETAQHYTNPPDGLVKILNTDDEDLINKEDLQTFLDYGYDEPDFDEIDLSDLEEILEEDQEVKSQDVLEYLEEEFLSLQPRDPFEELLKKLPEKDREMYYRGPDGNIRKVGESFAKKTSDPCLKCSRSLLSSGCQGCTMKDKFLIDSKIIFNHEMNHKVSKPFDNLNWGETLKKFIETGKDLHHYVEGRWVSEESHQNLQGLQGLENPSEKSFPKKDVCYDCSLGYKFCKNKCTKYLLS